MTLDPIHLTQALISYVPPAVVRNLHTDGRARAEPSAPRFDAAVLFADVSGFTALTEKLAARGAGGAEELTLLLNRYFSRMIDILESEGGEVVQFSGDALMAVFPADGAPLPACARHARQAAARMQDAMRDFAQLQTSAGTIELGMKIGIGAGEVCSFSVGGVNDRWQHIVAGDPLWQVAEAEHRAERGQVVLSPETQALSSGEALPPQPRRVIAAEALSAGAAAGLRGYIPDAVLTRLLAGQSDWIAEMRCLSILFLGVGGIVYDAPGGLAQAQAWMQACQQAVYRYEGILNKLLVDDKGTIGIALFGAPPFSHQDDPLRAVRCAFDLQKAAERQNLRLAIGVTTGLVFAGPVGSPSRREYTVMGDAVNLAARLMQLAERGNIRADHATHEATREQIIWEELPSQTLKGKAEAVRVFNPRAVQSLRATARTQTRIVNREAELQQLAQALDDSLQKQLRVLCLEGGAGLGKSRLIAELTGWARERGAQVLRGEGDAVEQQTSYSAWRSIFEAYFDIEELTEQAARRAQTLTVLSRIAPDLLARAPLLNNLLNLGIPETPLTANLEPKLRQASLSALLVDLLALRAQAQALVIVVEGAQWLDSLSWQLALLAARSLVDAPVLLALTLRPLAAPYPLSPPDHPYTLICALPCSRRLTISALAPADIVSLAASRLGSDELPADIARLIEQRASGNPLVAEALAVSLRDLGIIAVVDGECVVRGDIGELHVPDTLHGLVLSSLDRLPAEEQLALKLASVVGRAFGFAALRDIYPANMDRRQLPRSLHALIRREIVRAARPPTTLRTHSYAQAIVQEVTYSTLLQTQRRELHERIARWFEDFAADQQTDLHPLLAHHWRQAQNAERELRYAALAGRKLAAEYANHEALSFLNRALQLASDADKRFELLWLRMEVHDRIGDRQAQNEDLAQLEALAEQSADVRRRAQLANARADYHRNVSDFSAAIAQLQRARTLAQEARDSAAEARSLTLWGQVLEHQGSYREAKDYFAQALAIYQQIDYKRGEANNLSRLSNIYHYLGDRASARDYALQALAIRRAIGDRASEATSLTNLGRICAEMGEHDTARDYRQQALAVARTIGDRAGEAFSLLTIGNGYLTQGDYGEARRCLQQALRLFEMMGERRRTATCLNELGMVWREIGDAANGRRHFERALVIQQEIGNRSFAAYTHLNLGLTYLPADPATARAHYRSALALAQETGNRAVEAYALAYLAALHAQTGDWDAARRDYQTAIEINTELKAAPAAVEATAGLARVALAQSQAAEALQHARACLAHIAAKGVEGIEFPFEVYLACYDVLRATGEQAEAERALAQAHALLMRRADAISDPQLRESMLNNVAAHRRIIEEFVGRNAGG